MARPPTGSRLEKMRGGFQRPKRLSRYKMETVMQIFDHQFSVAARRKAARGGEDLDYRRPEGVDGGGEQVPPAAEGHEHVWRVLPQHRVVHLVHRPRVEHLPAVAVPRHIFRCLSSLKPSIRGTLPLTYTHLFISFFFFCTGCYHDSCEDSAGL